MKKENLLTIFFCFTFLFSLQGGASLFAMQKRKRSAEYAEPLYKKVAKRAFQGVTFPFRLLAKPMDYFFRNKKKKLEARGEVFGPKLDALHRLRESSLFTLALGDCRGARPAAAATLMSYDRAPTKPKPSWVRNWENWELVNWKDKGWTNVVGEKLKKPVDNAKFKAVVGRFPRSNPWTKKEQDEFLTGVEIKYTEDLGAFRDIKFVLVKTGKKIHLFNIDKGASTDDVLNNYFKKTKFEILGEREVLENDDNY